MFPKKYLFKKSTIITACFMVLSASFTKQLMDSAVMRVGEGGFKIIIFFILFSTAATFFFAEARRLRHPLRIFLMFAILISVFFFIRKIELPEVRMHILMYAIVGWLASRDMMRFDGRQKAIILAWLFAATAGILEELFQKILPYRVFDISDIIFNLAGASLGVIIYLIRPKRLAPAEELPE